MWSLELGIRTPTLRCGPLSWGYGLSEWNHVPHFLYFVTHYVDSMPIASIGGILCDVLFNPKYVGCVYNIGPRDIGGCSHLGSRAQMSKGHYMDYEIGSMDGAYKGRLHVVGPFIGQKTLTKQQKEYNDVHGFYRAHIEHLFARNF